MILRSREDWLIMIEAFDDQHRLHNVTPPSYPCIVKRIIVQEAMKDVYFVFFTLKEAQLLLEES